MIATRIMCEELPVASYQLPVTSPVLVLVCGSGNWKPETGNWQLSKRLDKRQVPPCDDGPVVLRSRTCDAAVRQLAPLLCASQQIAECIDPRRDVILRQLHAGIVHDVRDLAALARDDRDAAGHRLDQHAAELLAPRRR